MAKEKRAEERDTSNDWLSTYSDMITLVLTFFVLLYSMSTVDEKKWQYILQAFQSKGNIINQVVTEPKDPPDFLDENNLPGNADGEAKTGNSGMPQDMQELFQYLQTAVAKENLQSSVSISMGKDGNIFMRFKDNAFFAPNSEILRNDGKVILDFIADGLVGVKDMIASIKINGHSADVPGTLSDLSDRRLSSGRANSVAIYLDDKELIDPKKIIAIGFGKYHPIADNNTEEGRAQNRRVELIIMQNNMDLTDPEALRQYLASNYDVEGDIDPESLFKDAPPIEESSEPPEPPTVDIVEELTSSAAT